jgi:hypothetical protein
METTHHPITIPATVGSASCHSASQGSGSWLSRKRGLVFGGGALVAGTAVALSQHWLTAAELVPLLYLLPCAAMMFMCMKGMNHGQQTGGTQDSISPETLGTDTARR